MVEDDAEADLAPSQRFFILKSHNQFDLEQSAKTGWWATQVNLAPPLPCFATQLIIRSAQSHTAAQRGQFEPCFVSFAEVQH